MLILTIHTEHIWLAEALTASLSSKIVEIEITAQEERTWIYELVYSPKLDRDELSKLMTELEPLRPRKRVNRTLASHQVHLYLGSARQLSEFPIRVKSDGKSLSQRLSMSLKPHFQCELSSGSPLSSSLRFGGAPPFVRELILWWVYQECSVLCKESKVWGEEENDLHLQIKDPTLRGEEFRKSLALTLIIDEELEEAPIALPRLFSDYRPEICVLNGSQWPSDALSYGFVVDIGKNSLDLVEGDYLLNTVSEDLREWGVDLNEYPVTLQNLQKMKADFEPQSGSSQGINVFIPLSQWRNSLLHPLFGERLNRWLINILVDDLVASMPILQSLQNLGFSRIKGSSFEESRYRGMGGVYIDWGSAIDFPFVQHLVTESLSTLGEIPLLIEAPFENLVLDREHRSLFEGSAILNNQIKILVWTHDYSKEQWGKKLSTLCSQHSLSLLFPPSSHIGALQVSESLSRLPWNSIEQQYTSPNGETSTYQSFLEDLDSRRDRHNDQDDQDDQDDEVRQESQSLIESFDEEDSGWDHSELQEWLMESLHDGEDLQSSDHVLIYCSKSSLLIAEWLRALLKYDYELITHIEQNSLENDTELIIVFPQDHAEKIDQHSNDVVQSKTRQEGGLISAPRKNMPFEDHKEPIPNSLLLKYESSVQGELLLVWRGETVRVNPKNSDFLPQELTAWMLQQNESADLNKQQRVAHPYFLKLCDYLIHCVKSRSSRLITSRPKVGLGCALRWLAQTTHSPYLSASDHLERFEQLSLTSLISLPLPLLIVEDFDQLSKEQLVFIRRARLQVTASNEGSRLVMIGSLSSGSYPSNQQQESSMGASDQTSHMIHSGYYEGILVSSIQGFSIEDSYQLLRMKLGAEPPHSVYPILQHIQKAERFLLAAPTHTVMSDPLNSQIETLAKAEGKQDTLIPMGYKAIERLAELILVADIESQDEASSIYEDQRALITELYCTLRASPLHSKLIKHLFSADFR